MTVREVQGFLADQYGVDVSPEFISSVTDAVMAEVGAWQAHPLLHAQRIEDMAMILSSKPVAYGLGLDRAGPSGKTVLNDDGPLRIEVPRDRDASFEPLLIPKHERRFDPRERGGAQQGDLPRTRRAA